MKKIDLHQDIILSYSDRPESFFEDTYHANICNAGNYKDYIHSGIDISFAAIWPYDIDGDMQDLTNRQISFNEKLVREFAEKYKVFEKNIPFIRSQEDLQNNHDGLRLVLHLEGHDTINTPQEIDAIFDLGVRSFGITWNFDTNIAGAAQGSGIGLTETGKDLISYLQHKGIIVDTAHMHDKGMHEILDIATKPILNSHSNLYTLNNHPRNVTDTWLDRLPKNGGVLGLSIYTPFVGADSMEAYIEQIRYVVNRIGEDHVGLGTDFHGISTDKAIQHLSSITGLNILEQEVIKAFGSGFAEKFFYKNAYRVLQDCLPTA